MKRANSASAVLAATLALSALSVASVAFAHESSDDFVEKASIANTFEIQSSKIALKRSHNDGVRQFAQQMVDDHTQTASKMKAALRSSNTDPSLADLPLDSRHQKQLGKLASASDRDFDALYIKEQAKAHDQAVKLFKDYSRNGDDASLKTFAAQTLPTLKEHQEHVKELKAQ